MLKREEEEKLAKEKAGQVYSVTEVAFPSLIQKDSQNEVLVKKAQEAEY